MNFKMKEACVAAGLLHFKDRNYLPLYGSYSIFGLYVPSRNSPDKEGISIFIPGRMRLGSSGFGRAFLFAS